MQIWDKMQGMQRLFFGFEIDIPWPYDYPAGRLLSEKERHMTLVFLGFVDPISLEESMKQIPLPSFSIGPIGLCDRVLFLPEKHPRTVSWHIQWLSKEMEILHYRAELLKWLQKIGYSLDTRSLIPHVTIARMPFEKEEWLKEFTILPCMIKALHLYESIGNLHYPSRWKLSLQPAFEEFEHTADLAFLIHAHSLQELYRHAALALSFKFPPLAGYITAQPVRDLYDIIHSLNDLIAIVDQKLGCPFKAVSYHGQFRENTWEMIVDV